jgi:hypothetical protein
MMNIDYKCPYCDRSTYIGKSKPQGTKFPSWKAVRSHVANCTKNTKSFMICDYYGPIPLSILEQYNTPRDFRRDYPNFSLHSHQWTYLRESGKASLKSKNWTKESIIKSLQQFYLDNKRSPGTRDLVNNSSYVDFTTVQNYFNSFNEGLVAAGLEITLPNQFGIPTVGKDGYLYRSKSEAYFVDNYLYEKCKYIYEPKYKEKLWTYDFYLPDKNLYIELTAYINPKRIQDKVQYHIDNSINCLIIETSKIRDKDYINKLLQ